MTIKPWILRIPINSLAKLLQMILSNSFSEWKYLFYVELQGLHMDVQVIYKSQEQDQILMPYVVTR